MKTLHEYLANYIQHEIEVRNGVFDCNEMLRWLEEGITAYQSTENCVIVITGGECPDCGTKLVFREESTFTPDGDDLEIGCYECPDCGYETYC